MGPVDLGLWQVALGWWGPQSLPCSHLVAQLGLASGTARWPVPPHPKAPEALLSAVVTIPPGSVLRAPACLLPSWAPLAPRGLSHPPSSMQGGSARRLGRLPCWDSRGLGTLRRCLHCLDPFCVSVMVSETEKVGGDWLVGWALVVMYGPLCGEWSPQPQHVSHLRRGTSSQRDWVGWGAMGSCTLVLGTAVVPGPACILTL